MTYQSDTIQAVISRLNNRYFLPAIQREFVWSPDQVVKLFDSLLRGYPISSFLFWELNTENRDRWDVYKFLDEGSQRGARNSLASTDGAQQVALVLDGQQRLTSMLLGLKGRYEMKVKYRRWDDPQAWRKRSLYLNLLKDPKVAEEEEEGLYYGLAFLDEPVNGNGEYWIKVGRILDFDSDDRFYAFRQEVRDSLPGTVTLADANLVEKNLERLYRAIWRDVFISYYTEHDQDYDRVLDIFVRANEGGTKLSKSDLLLSMVTLHWNTVNARDEIYGFVDRLNAELTRKNDLDKDFVMKACLVLSELPAQYRVNNFSRQNLATIEANWPTIRKAVESAVDLVNSFGIDRDNLLSANAIIPVAYYLLRQDVNLRGTTPFDSRNAEAVRRWFTTCLLNNVFSGASDTALTNIRQILRETATSRPADFPIDAINSKLAESGRTARFDEDAIDNFLHITYGGRTAFLALSLLRDDRSWGTMTFHQDHIFPRSLFSTKALTDAGIPQAAHWKYSSSSDRIGNLQLLNSGENLEKSNHDFRTWLLTRDRGFKTRQLVPDDESLYTMDRFEDFLKAREELIAQRLRGLLSAEEITEVA